MQDKVSIRKTITYTLSSNIGKWWTPLQMQSIMWKMDAKIPIEEIQEIMDDIYVDSLDNPSLNKFEKDYHQLCYRCTAYFTAA